MNENIFDKLDFGPFRSLLDDDDITDIFVCPLIFHRDKMDKFGFVL